MSMKGKDSLKRLIVNADGFGFGPGATQGILDAIAGGGPITSVSVNANFSDVSRLGELVQRYPHVSVGVHLNPISGRPCLPADVVPTLVGGDGLFLRGDRFRSLLRRGQVALSELAAEFDAQIEAVKRLAGDRVTHLDSHGNSHVLYFPLILSLARKWGIRCMRTTAPVTCLEAPRPGWARASAYARRPHTFFAHFYRRMQMKNVLRAGILAADGLVTVGHAGVGNKSLPENWLRIFRNLPEGTFEIYCHPAYPDDVLRHWASYAEPRRQELEILRTAELRQAAEAAQVRLISFFDLMES